MNIGTKSDVFVLTEEQRHVLMDYNRQWLLEHPPPSEAPPPPGAISRLTTPTTYDENRPKD